MGIRNLIVGILLLLVSDPSLAGGRGGHNTNFDPNSYGGGWTTINCGGVDDNTAFSNWKTAAVAANPALAKLRITGNCILAADEQITTGINNAIIWGYGSTITRPFLGGASPIGAANFVNSVSAGATSVILKSAGDAVNFVIGSFMLVNGLENQGLDCGFPPNPQFFDYVLVTAINSATISFTPALTNSYLDTWPLVCSDGPANAMPMSSSWNTNIQIFGLTIRDTGQVVTNGRTIQIQDTVFPTNGIDPSVSNSITVSNSNIRITEMDKIVESFICNSCNGEFIQFQSAGIKHAEFVNLKLASRFQGTSYSTQIKNSIIGELWIGPDGYGAGQSIFVENVTTSSLTAGIQFIAASSLSYSSGTFSLAKTDPAVTVFLHMGVPGHKYAFASVHFNDFSSPLTTFTINAIREDASNYYWDTSLVGALPSPTCGGGACSSYVSYPASTIVQRFTPGVNLTQYQAP